MAAMARGVALVLLGLAALVGRAEGKGRGVSSRSTGYGAYGAGYGGGYRGYYGGAYAPYNRYYVYPIMWRHGTRSRDYKDPKFEEKLSDVFCKRKVTIEQSTASATFRSVKDCYHQNSPQPGSPKNKEMEGLILDEFRWIINATSQGPSVTFEFYPDTGSTGSPTFTYTTLFKSLVNTQTDLGTVMKTIDLGQAFTTLSQPVASTMPMSNLFTVAMVAGDLHGHLLFQLADDFTEDSGEHLFHRPDALTVIYTLSPSSPTTLLNTTRQLTYSIQASNAKSSTFAAATVGTVYNPPKMDRVIIGSKNDADERKGGWVAWRRSSVNKAPCLLSDYAAQCTVTGCNGQTAGQKLTCGTSPSAITSDTIAMTSQWTELNMGGQIAEQSQRFHIGYHDVTVGTAPSSAGAQRPALLCLAALLAFLALAIL